MSNYKQTLALLDGLIAKLAANTGGEPLLPSQTTLPTATKPVITKPVVPQPVIATQQPAAKEGEKREGEKREGRKGKGEGKPKEEEKPKLPEGVDADVLIFAQVDLRVSEIVECWKHPQSQNLYCQKILVGAEVREIASGLQQFVALGDMRGKVIVMTNLKPRPLAGFTSNGMVVCASNPEHTKVELLVPEGPLGERLFLQGAEEAFAGEPGVVKKSKVLEKVVEHFATDNEGFVVWKGYRLRTKAGYIKSTIANGKVS